MKINTTIREMIKRNFFKTIVFVFAAAMLSMDSSAQKKPVPFAKGEFKTWVQTPPMGWNSWDCYGLTVEEQERDFR